MSSTNLQDEWAAAYLSGGSMAYLDELYEDFLADPQSVPEAWRTSFEKLSPEANGQEMGHREIREHFLKAAYQKKNLQTKAHDSKQYQVASLINDYRAYGHQAANLDPIHLQERAKVPNLELSYHDLSESDLNDSFYAGKSLSQTEMPLRDIIAALKETYCGSIGVEYMHITNTEENEWIQHRMESVRGKPAYSAEKKKQILKDLVAADGMEKYLGRKYVGQKRFSLEGGDSFIPMLKEMILLAADQSAQEVVIGMAHRGRLNVLVNVLGKEPNKLFQEFEGVTASERTGDVKYHMGFSSDLRTAHNKYVHIALAFNPSHLEIIGPVVEGSVRSRLNRRHDIKDKKTVVPIIVHGDAAFSGQGVVMETFNFSQSRGYCTGGTLHIVINNQIGFTTSNPLDARSTLYCTDVAKMVQAPIIHVNGDDPEAVIFAAQMATDFRMKFKRDIVVDLVCYRRHGHNEADEPSVTQPTMYQQIKAKQPLREIYAEQLIAQGLLDESTAEEMNKDYRDALDQGKAIVDLVKEDYEGKISIDWQPYIDTDWSEKADTTITKETFEDLSKTLLHIPEGFNVHPVVKRLHQEREKMSLGEQPMNWGYAETMAYASLLNDGFGVRLSGQDSGRGTFAHRHAVLHDAESGALYVPLEQVAHEPNKGFSVIDSVLSEEAVLAFEYGYASSDPHALVIWEAQFGDFANGAQVVIDQFISSGEQKWGRLSGLTMFLPHGYEGQGPEHSSARLERFLQLCAQHNMQVCVPSTPAQIFHLLRRQMIRNFRKPLIVMTPKSLLRHKLAVSPLDDLFHGRFYNVIPELDKIEPKKVSRVILCSGKVYYDLLQRRREEGIEDIAIIRVEQLYPFPRKSLSEQLNYYAGAKEVVWCQEEPKNQGAWFPSQHYIRECMRADQVLSYAGRGFAAAPAVGSPKLHASQQQSLVEEALKL